MFRCSLSSGYQPASLPERNFRFTFVTKKSWYAETYFSYLGFLMRTTVTLAFIVVVATFASAQGGLRINPGEHSNRNAEYRSNVSNYCRLDYDGARLSPEGWARLQPLTSWRQNPDYKRFVVVTRYQILPDMRYEHGRYIFDVQYDASGEYDLAGGYFPGAMSLTVQVEVSELSGDIRVVETSEGRPFVGRPRFLQWLQAKLNTETDPAAKATFQTSLQRLQDQTKKPLTGQ